MCATQETMAHACLLDLNNEVDKESIKEMAPWTYYLLSEADQKEPFKDTIFTKEQ